MEIEMGKPLPCDAWMELRDADGNQRKQPIIAGSTITITPPPDPTPKKPKPVLVVPIGVGYPVADQTYFKEDGRATIAKTSAIEPCWVAKQVSDPPILTAKQLEALAVFCDSDEPRKEWARVALAFAGPRTIRSVLTELAARVREVMGDE